MMSVPDIFWDTCVFAAHLYDETSAYGASGDHIRQYLREAEDGKWRIVTSSVVFAELAFSKVRKGAPGTIEDLVADLSTSCLVVEPNPNIMILAGKLRDIPYKKQKSDKRRLTVPDAIMLATAIYAKGYCTDFRGFHTFDRGGRKGEIPVIRYEEWLEDVPSGKLAIEKQVVEINRCQPQHSAPELPYGE